MVLALTPGDVAQRQGAPIPVYVDDHTGTPPEELLAPVVPTTVRRPTVEEMVRRFNTDAAAFAAAKQLRAEVTNAYSGPCTRQTAHDLYRSAASNEQLLALMG